MLELAAAGYGPYIKVNEDRDDLLDIEGMKEFFAERGYEFVPGFGEKQNYFKAPDGMLYGNDYVIYLLREGKIK